VKQKIASNGEVVESFKPEALIQLNKDPEVLETIHNGMEQVVHASYGTGKGAKLSYTPLCGKTGTAEWGRVTDNKRLAWFAGFFPRDKPKYAFAALYEGDNNESLSGGRRAAPIVAQFFESVKDDVVDAIGGEKTVKFSNQNPFIKEGVYQLNPISDASADSVTPITSQRPTQSYRPHLESREPSPVIEVIDF